MSATEKAKKELNKALSAARADRDAAQKEVDKIEKALASLGGIATRRARSVASRNGSKSSGRRGRPAKKGGRQDQVLAYIKKQPDGTSSGEIAKALKMNPSAVSQIITKLNKEKVIKKDGRKISAV